MNEVLSPSASPSEVLVSRVRSIVEAAALDAPCRQRVKDALERFVALEQQREIRHHLLSSRRHRAAIVSLMDLLGELEETNWHEADRSVFTEFAALFEDIAQHALRGASDLRLLAEGVTTE